MPYPFDQIFAADPERPEMVATNAPVVVFAPGDETKTPLTLTALNGLPLENPIIVNDRGFGPAFIADLDQVAWEGGGLTGLMASYRGLKDDAETAARAAVVAREAAEEAARNTVAPTAEVVAEALTSEGPAREAVNAAINAGTTNLALKPDNGAKPVGKGELVINVKDYGAKGDGVADDTEAIIAAEAAAMALGGDAELLMPAGRYRTSATVWFRCNLSASQATIRYYGTGTAVVVGDDRSIAISTPRRDYRLPRVICMNRGTNGWDGTSVGVKCVNLNTCQVWVPFVQDFETGLLVYGYGGGMAHSTFHLGALWENHKNLVLSSDTTGYSNQNLFLNGRLQHSTTKGAVLNDRDAKQIWLTGEGVPSEGANAGRPNNNTFINTSFEGHNVAYYKADIDGRYNVFLNCRWETQSTAPRVLYRETARWNKIDGGYNALTIEETFLGTLGGGELRDHVGCYVRAAPIPGQSVPNNAWVPVLWDMQVGRRISLNSATGEFTPRPGRWLIMASVAFAPNASGRRIARMNVGGSVADIAEAPGNAVRTSLKLQLTDTFDGTKTVKVEANQTSGADLTLEATPPYVTFRAEYLGY